MGAVDSDVRKHVLRRWQALSNERSSWVPQWREISKNLLPRSGRFLNSDRNKGDKAFNKIYDSTPTRALRILAAGMMSGMTSPARPWFSLSINNKDALQDHAVQLWLHSVTTLMHQVFDQSNTYEALQAIYEELGAFGTAATVIQFDYDGIIHHHPLTAGEYCIATDNRGRVDTLYRKFDMTVSQLVQEFGINNVSESVRNRYEKQNLDDWVTVIHAIEPRRGRDVNKPDAQNMRFRSVYIEEASRDGKVLRESGFKRFPALCPRWVVSGGDIYGTSPGLEALGDIRQLQVQQKRKAQAIDYKVSPPLVLPTNLSGRVHDTLPGGIVFADAQAQGIRSLYEVNIDLSHLQQDIQETQGRINSTFFSDLFMMISQQDKRMTATEVSERQEEKMLMLGPVLERLQNELLKPLIEITFNYMDEAGILPPVPEELQGQDIDIQFVSILAQAQVAVRMGSINQFVSGITQLAGARPDILDNIDFDGYVAVAAESLGISPKILANPDAVEAIRAQRQQQEQLQQQMAVAGQAADAVQKLGNAEAGGVLDNLTGYA